MAWRIDQQVVRGEIDNRVRGRVVGRIWFVGRTAPVELDFAGNAWRDLAGRKLEFVNPEPKPGDLQGLGSRQTGVIGDCTASRKVRVPDVSMDELAELYRQRKPFPWHWGNSLYLEWFATKNGRVVIESVGFQLTIVGDSAWEMTPAEEEIQRLANSEALGSFMGQLGEPVDEAALGSKAMDPDEDDTQPMSEAEAEKLQEESDRLVDRIQARLEREGPDADYDKILKEELERRARERGEPPLTPEEEAKRAAWIEEMNRISDDAVANPDPGLRAELELKHPLAERALLLAGRVMDEPEARGWVPDDATLEHPVVDLGNQVMSASAKLAGALNGCTWPPGLDTCGNTIVRLKRARGYLSDALLAAEVCDQQRLVEGGWLVELQRELNTIGRACDELIGELRARLARKSRD